MRPAAAAAPIHSHKRMLKIVGIILVVIGIAALVAQGITYTKREKVLDVGPIHATAEKEHTIPLSPIVGVSALVVGGALLVVGATKKV